MMLITFAVTKQLNKNMKTDIVFDVIIIGGSYAGLSSAMSLGRSCEMY